MELKGQAHLFSWSLGSEELRYRSFIHRTQHQKYVWWCREPPSHVVGHKMFTDFRKGYFNWTMTFRRDADISTPWGLREDVKSILKKRNSSLQQIMKAKKKLAVR